MRENPAFVAVDFSLPPSLMYAIAHWYPHDLETEGSATFCVPKGRFDAGSGCKKKSALGVSFGSTGSHTAHNREIILGNFFR